MSVSEQIEQEENEFLDDVESAKIMVKAKLYKPGRAALELALKQVAKLETLRQTKEGK